MNDIAINSFHSVIPEVVEELSERSPQMRNLIDQNWPHMPRYNVSQVVIKKISGKFQVSIWRTDDAVVENRDVPVDADLARVCNRLNPKNITFNGDSMIPIINFDWVNSADTVSFNSGENRQNIAMFLAKYTRSNMDFHSTIPVTADEVLRSMTSLTSLRYFCGSGNMMDGIVSKDTLRLMAEKSNVGSGIAHIFLSNRVDDGIIEPQDITKFLRNAKFEDYRFMEFDEGRWSRPFVWINHVSATQQEFENHLAVEGFNFRILCDTDYKISFNDRTVNLLLKFSSV